MTITLWIIESLLGLIFLITGSFKFFSAKEKIVASGGTWAADFNPYIIKTIAGIELLSGLSVIIPRLLGHGHYLTFISSACIAVIMIGAIYIHIKRKEFMHASINGVFLLMALFVVYYSNPF